MEKIPNDWDGRVYCKSCYYKLKNPDKVEEDVFD